MSWKENIIAYLNSSLSAIKAVVDAIQAKTDNLPASPAPASEYDTEMARITADVATEAKQDAIDGAIGTEYVNGNGLPESDNVRAHLFKVGPFGGGKAAEKSVAIDGSASYPLFTVTGFVAVVVIGYITIAVTNHADTLSVGTTSSNAIILAAQAGSAMQNINSVWKSQDAPARALVSAPLEFVYIGNSEDITLYGTANLIAGNITFICYWIPILDGSEVVAIA